MIVLNLQCSDGHSFEGWFDSVAAFDEQMSGGMMACPLCGQAGVTRLPSGSHVAKSTYGAESGHGMAQMMRVLSEMAQGSEDVAERFPEEARRMHYGETAPRHIRGQATLNETRELLEEGIPVLPLPFPPKEDTH